MKTKGKLLLFETFAEFSAWLQGVVVTRTISLVQNHHTWMPDYPTFRKLPDHFHWLESMEAFQEQNGFNQIGQNFTTFPDGSIALCRPLDIIPAGIKGANQNGICIEHLGNFDLEHDVMTPEHSDTVLKLNAALCKKFGIALNVNGIVYHHWYDIVTGQRTNGTGTVKSCPGTGFFGGNSVEACQTGFLPLVENALKTL